MRVSSYFIICSRSTQKLKWTVVSGTERLKELLSPVKFSSGFTSAVGRACSCRRVKGISWAVMGVTVYVRNRPPSRQRLFPHACLLLFPETPSNNCILLKRIACFMFRLSNSDIFSNYRSSTSVPISPAEWGRSALTQLTRRTATVK
jgi:hypothetical protein